MYKRGYTSRDHTIIMLWYIDIFVSFPSFSGRYTKPSFVILAAGVLPFGSIFIEMYFILTSLWGYVYYYVFGFMLLVFIIMVVVIVCTTIVAVYTVLNAEARKRKWRFRWGFLCRKRFVWRDLGQFFLKEGYGGKVLTQRQEKIFDWISDMLLGDFVKIWRNVEVVFNLVIGR